MDKRSVIFQEVRSAKEVSVIVVVFKRGAGIEDDPVRLVTQYWSMDGCLLAECDPEQAPWLVSEDNDGRSQGDSGSEALRVGPAPELHKKIFAELSKLFKLLDAPEDVAVYIWDPPDPDRRFVIRRSRRTKGEATDGKSSEQDQD